MSTYSDYFWVPDGSFRDIYIKNTTIAEWEMLYNHLMNQPDCNLEYCSDGYKYIRPEKISKVMRDTSYSHYFQFKYMGEEFSFIPYESEIEIFIDPKDITDKDSVIRFMILLKSILNMPVYLNYENERDDPYLIV